MGKDRKNSTGDKMKTPNKQAELEKEMIKRIITSFDIKERKARTINKDYKNMGRFKSNYSLSEMEHALEDGIKETKAQAISEFKERLIEKFKDTTPIERESLGYTLDIIEKTAQEIKV